MMGENIQCPACDEVNYSDDIEDGRCPTCDEYMHDWDDEG